MKKMTYLVISTLIFTSSLSAQSQSQTHSKNLNEVQSNQFFHGYRDINLEDLVELVHSSPPSLSIIDARSAKFDDGKRIPGAKAIPADAPIENISANLPDKAAMIIVYCSNTRCPASRLLADRLVKMGYTNVWKYAGGIKEWKENGQRLEQGKPASQAAQESGPKSA